MQKSNSIRSFELLDPSLSPEFLANPLRGREAPGATALLERLGRLVVDEPAFVPQVVVEIACELCDADLACIVLADDTKDGPERYTCTARAGTQANLAEVLLPHAPLALQQGTDDWKLSGFQLLCKSCPDHDVSAMPTLFGLLLPWKSGDQRAALWIATQGRTPVLNPQIGRSMRLLAELASIAGRNLQFHKALVRQVSAAAASAMAHALAHQINNPLQSITNSLFLAMHSSDEGSRLDHVQQASQDLRNLSRLVGDLLLLYRPAISCEQAATA